MADALTVGLSRPIEDAQLQSINFFNGRLLVSGDLKAEQQARRLAIRRLGRTVGRGVLEGFAVAKVSSNPKAGIVLRIESGTAISSQGAVLDLLDPVELKISGTTSIQSATKTGGALFAPCGVGVRTIGSQKTQTGAKVLFVVPDTVEKGRAPLVAMDMSAAGCNIDRIAEAVRFELADVGAIFAGHEGIDEANSRNVSSDILLGQELTICPEGVPLAFLRFDELGNLQYLDMWSVRRLLSSVARPERRIPKDKGALADSGFWDHAVSTTVDPVAQARILQFQDHLADHLARARKLRSHERIDFLREASKNESTRPPAAAEVFPRLPPAGMLPANPSLLKELFPDHAFENGSLPRIDARSAPLLLRDALEVAAKAIENEDKRFLKVYRIGEGETGGYLFAKARPGRVHSMEVAYDPSALEKWGMEPPRDPSGHPSVQASLDDLYRRMKDAKRESLSAEQVTMDPKEPLLGANAADSFRNLSDAVQTTNSRDWPASQVILQPGSTGGSHVSLQEAFEAFRARLDSVSGLTHVLAPGTWRATLEELSNQQARAASDGVRRDLNLFFEPGVYETANPIVLSGFGDVRIQGAGAGTVLRSSETESVLHIERCLSCTLVDVSFQALATTFGSGEPSPFRPRRPKGRLEIEELRKLEKLPKNRIGLRGALSIVGVPKVHLERVGASCVGGLQRSSCAISVHNLATASSRIAIRDAIVESGDSQVGILVVDGGDVEIASCEVRSAGPTIPGMEIHGARSAASLLANSFLELSKSPRPESSQTGTKILATDRNFVVALLESMSVTGLHPVAAWDWARAVYSNGLPGDDAAFQRFYRRIETFFRMAGTDEASKDPVLAGFCASFAAWQASRPAVADRGIVVAGKTRVSAKIVGNRVSGAAIGILVAASRSDDSTAKRAPSILARSVLVRDNRISVPDLSGRPGQAAGILVGNAEEARIQENEVEVADQSLRRDRIEAVRAWGWFGRRLGIDGNTARGHHAGLHVRPLAEALPDRQVSAWSVRGNVCEGLVLPVSIAGKWSTAFRIEDNFS